MKTILGKGLLLMAVACGSLLTFAGDASAGHWGRSRCHTATYYASPTYYSYPTRYTYAVPTTYTYAYTYAPAPVYYTTTPVYAPAMVYIASPAPIR